MALASAPWPRDRQVLPRQKVWVVGTSILAILPAALCFVSPTTSKTYPGTLVSADRTLKMEALSTYTRQAPTNLMSGWLQTLHMYPVDEQAKKGSKEGVPADTSTPSAQNKVQPRPHLFQSRCLKALTGTVVVALATCLLCLGTARLDVLAHSASSLLGSSSLTVAAIAGAGAGSLHTLSGPDHLALLTPLALRAKGRSAAFKTGVFWGSGHVVGQLLLGVGMLLVGHSRVVSTLINSSGIGSFAENAGVAAVGLVLVLIGCLGFKEANEWQDDEEAQGGEAFSWKTFGTGVLSGMHPDALLLCLPALALPTRLAGISFLAAFGAGTLAAMGGFTAALHTAAQALGPRAVRRISMISSGVAIAVGGAVCASVAGMPLLGGLL